MISFFKRRKILKSVNTLDLHPIKNYSEEIDSEGLIKVLIPKIKNEFLRNLFSKKTNNIFIRVKLDKYGSEVWKRIDGVKDVDSIVKEMVNIFSNEMNDVENRTINFIFILYQQDFITFKELQN
ncbi:MAG: PqqD family protein [Ignavibacterium sp.]|nr:PqqD family protein [Ignavibacterium sp.]